MSEQEMSFRDRLAKMLPPAPVDPKTVPHKSAIRPECPQNKSFVPHEYDPSQFPFQTV